MKKLFLLCLLTAFFFIYCKNQNTSEAPSNEIGLKELICDGKSILGKLNSKFFYNFNQEFGSVKKYSVELFAKPINDEIVSVMVDSIEAQGSTPNYICNLMDGINTIIITVTSKKDATIKKEYKIKISKSNANVPDENGSKLKEIKADDVNILSKFKKYVCELSDIVQTKNEISLYIVPHNESAIVTVKGRNGAISTNATNTYKVPIDYGINNIHVLVKSEKEGELLYRILVYRKQDLSLKSFKIEGTEYCDKNTGLLTKDVFSFLIDKVNVSVLTKNANTTLTFKHNGKEIKAKGGFYSLDLDMGRNGVELIVTDKDGIRNNVYTMLFIKNFPTSGGLIKLDADGNDLIHLLSTSNSITLIPRHNENSSLRLEVLAMQELLIKVKQEGSEINGIDGVYNVNLREGNNNILLELYKVSTLLESYSIFVKRHTKIDEQKIPEADEVEVSFVLSDGINGSSIDGSYINICKTQDAQTLKRILVKNGKAKTNLKKNTFYDFKVEGRNDEYATTKYAASNVISYYIGSESKIVPIVQRQMQRITKNAEAPIVDSLTFGTETITAGNVITSDTMKVINMNITTVAHIEKLRFSTPLPMLAIGFVPSTDEHESSNVLSATIVQDSTKHGNKWKSIWSWNSNIPLMTTEDVVIVVYDVASNRLEYHLRIQPSSVAITEDSEISITNMSLEFERFPTQSNIYSVGQDEKTKSSSHYTSNISFEAKKNGEAINLSGFDLYRKEEKGDFEFIKHVAYKTLKNQTHKVSDTDGGLEDNKTYQYKIVAYTADKRKSSLNKSEALSIKVPKSTALLLEYPVNRTITMLEAKNLDYVFKFSNSEILKDAVEMRAGFLISNRVGNVLHGSKFRYVFKDFDGKPAIYFARRSDAILKTGGYYGTKYSIKGNKIANIDDLISVDQEKGLIIIKKDFFNLAEINIIEKKSVKYEKGASYYWDIVDYGFKEYTDYDDRPCEIIHKPSSNVTITSFVNDKYNGNNAWNGRAEFSLIID